MKKLPSLMLAAATLVFAACSKQDPPVTPVLSSDTPVANVTLPYRPATEAQKKALRDRLLEITDQVVKSRPKAAEFTPISWKDAVNKDLQVSYISCVVPPGTNQGTYKCHLETTAKNPVRYLLLSATSPDGPPSVAYIRTEDAQYPNEYMFCPKLTVDQHISSLVSGDCFFNPHDAPGLHWFTAALLWSEKTKSFSSVYFVYLDKKPTNETDEDVHNGEGHAGDD
jgi:hypothetical protein